MIRRTLLVLMLMLPAVHAPVTTHAQDAAQPELPKEPLSIATRDGKVHAFQVEMALSGPQQTIGLMFRPSVPADGGMLFDWGTPRDSNMWMRNTVSALDMLFINQDGTIRRIAEDTVPVGACGRHGEAPGHPCRRRGPPAHFRECAVALAQYRPRT